MRIDARSQAPDDRRTHVQALGGTGDAIASGAPDAGLNEDEIALARARRILQFIRCSKEFFPAMGDLADHPSWEIMLHLFIVGREGRAITTADLCDLTGTWRPLAVRYIEMLSERDVIDRDVSAEEPDAWALTLTPSSDARLRELLCRFQRQDEVDAAN